jgi:hypothetical protein
MGISAESLPQDSMENLEEISLDQYADIVLENLKKYPDTFNKIKECFAEQYDDPKEYLKHYNFWKCYFNKMYDENTIPIFSKDYEHLACIMFKLRQEHIINWTRKTLYEIKEEDDLQKIKEIILNKTFCNDTKKDLNIVLLKIFFYFIRLYIDQTPIYLDDYMVKHIPKLQEFTVNDVK